MSKPEPKIEHLSSAQQINKHLDNEFSIALDKDRDCQLSEEKTNLPYLNYTTPAHKKPPRETVTREGKDHTAC